MDNTITIDQLEETLIQVDIDSSPMICLICCDMIDHLSSQGAFLIEQNTTTTYSVNRETDEKTFVDYHMGPEFYTTHHLPGTLRDLAIRASELRKSAKASWSGLRLFFIKLLLCILPLLFLWNSAAVRTILENTRVFNIVSVILCIVLCTMWIILSEDKGEGARIGLSGIPVYWFAWFGFKQGGVAVHIQLLLILVSIGYVALFLTRFRIIQTLVNNLPVLSREKHLRDKEEYDQIYHYAHGRVSDILQKIEIAKKYVDFPAEKKEVKDYTKSQQGWWFLTDYYKTLLHHFE